MSVDQILFFYVCYDVEKVKNHWHRVSALGGVGVRSQMRDHLTVGKNSERTTFSGKRSSRKKKKSTPQSKNNCVLITLALSR